MAHTTHYKFVYNASGGVEVPFEGGVHVTPTSLATIGVAQDRVKCTLKGHPPGPGGYQQVEFHAYYPIPQYCVSSYDTMTVYIEGTARLRSMEDPTTTSFQCGVTSYMLSTRKQFQEKITRYEVVDQPRQYDFLIGVSGVCNIAVAREIDISFAWTDKSGVSPDNFYTRIMVTIVMPIRTIRFEINEQGLEDSASNRSLSLCGSDDSAWTEELLADAMANLPA